MWVRLFFLFFLSLISTTRTGSIPLRLVLCLECSESFPLFNGDPTFFFFYCCTLGDPRSSSIESTDRSLDFSIMHSVFSKLLINNLKILASVTPFPLSWSTTVSTWVILPSLLSSCTLTSPCLKLGQLHHVITFINLQQYFPLITYIL